MAKHISTHTTFNVWKYFSPPLSYMAFDAEAHLTPPQRFNKNTKLLYKPTPDNTYIHSTDPRFCQTDNRMWNK